MLGHALFALVDSVVKPLSPRVNVESAHQRTTLPTLRWEGEVAPIARLQELNDK